MAEKVYAVIYHDYEEHAIRYICKNEDTANVLADKLNKRDHMFMPEGSESYCRYVVVPFDLIDLESDAIETVYPKYVRVTVNYRPDGGPSLDDKLEVVLPNNANYYYEDNLLPPYAKHIAVIVTDNHSSTTNDMEFVLFLPVTKDDTSDTLKAVIIQLVKDIFTQLNEKNHPVNFIIHTDLRNFDPDMWRIENFGNFYVGLTRFPNPYMENAVVDDTEGDPE